MNAAELLKQGKLSESLAKLQEQVRNDPSASKHRVFLFQLLCVIGRWDKALTQLNLSADLDPKALLMAEVCRQLLQCEALRADIFAGKKSPLLFGKPQEWVGWLVQANHLFANGNAPAAQELRDKAFEAAPAVSGTVNGQPFEWIADADPRMGPVLEAIIEGKSFWVPMSNIRQIKIEPPADLRDVVWLPVNFTWANGGTAVGFIPTRYPGSENVDDDLVKLARKTDWVTKDGLDVPLGQRLFATDTAEYPILEVRTINLNAPMTFDDKPAARVTDEKPEEGGQQEVTAHG